MKRALAHIARGFILLVRPMHLVEQAQRFLGPVEEIALVRLPGMHAAHVDICQLHRRVTVVDPIRQRLADATGRQDADRVEPAGAEQPLNFGRLAQKVAVIGREAFGAVEEQLDTRVSQRRHTFDGHV